MAKLSLDLIGAIIREIHDFPYKGIVFIHITPVLAYPEALGFSCRELANSFEKAGIQKDLSIESRGFFFGTGIAERLAAGLVPVRKAGKLHWQTVQESYKLEYGEAVLEILRDAIARG